MASTIEGKIQVALFTRLAALSLSPALPIAWPDVNFAKPANGKYLEGIFIPNGAERQWIDSDGAHRFFGMLQVSVHWPSGAGSTAPTEIGGAVAGHFPADLILTEGGVSVRITKRPDVGGPITETTGAMVPVTIEYEVYE